MSRRPVEVVRACLRAYATQDRAALEALLADDYRFTSPMDDALDRDAYWRICWPHSQDFVAFDIVHEAENGDLAFVTYEARTRSGHRFRNTELNAVRDGMLVATEVYFGWDLPHQVAKGEHAR
ncbi:MAG TPA: nuclear transport factor 2 family protein [Usitatibacter sp.]|nr:nuclear transport factor 2 family protein [Usitatibacter sp.]